MLYNTSTGTHYQHPRQHHPTNSSSNDNQMRSITKKDSHDRPSYKGLSIDDMLKHQHAPPHASSILSTLVSFRRIVKQKFCQIIVAAGHDR